MAPVSLRACRGKSQRSGGAAVAKDLQDIALPDGGAPPRSEDLICESGPEAAET